MRFGMRRLIENSAPGHLLPLLSIFLFALIYDGHPNLYLLMLYLVPVSFFFGTLFGNLNATDGDGTATVILPDWDRSHWIGINPISNFFGILTANAYDGTVFPLVSGFAILGRAALVIIPFNRRLRLEAEA